MTDRVLDRGSPRAVAPTPDPLNLGTGLEDLHELRVRIPVDLHRQLLSLKVLRGRSLAESVSQALDLYFSRQIKAADEGDDAEGNS